MTPQLNYPILDISVRGCWVNAFNSPHTAKQAVTLPLDTATPEPTLCTISVTGAYPLLFVADVQGEGVASTLSKAGIWNMLSIDQ